MGIVAAILIARKRCKKVRPSAGATVTHSGRVNCKPEELSNTELASLTGLAIVVKYIIPNIALTLVCSFTPSCVCIFFI